MSRRPPKSRWLSMVAVVVLTIGCDAEPAGLRGPLATESAATPAIAAAAADYSDGAGKLWHQPFATTGLSWNQVAGICPRDGFSTCSGSIGTRDLTGWVWATGPQVIKLLGVWAPDLLTSPTSSVSGPAYAIAGIGLLNVFTRTQWFANTYHSSEWVGGWTSSTDVSGAPIAAGGGWSTPPHSGALGLGPIADPNLAIVERGVFLWRADGSDGRAVVANNDAGSVAAPGGGTAVSNVLANDLLAGSPATISTVTLFQLASSRPGVTLDPADGSVDVAVGTPAGAATLDYRICETANPSNCGQAIVTVTVTGNVIDAIDDAGSTKTGGGTAVANVRANDSFGVPVTLSAVSTTDARVSLDVADGSVDVAAGTAAGTQLLVYRLCETASPTNCDTATVTVTVTNYLIDAVNDQGSAPSSTGGVAVPNVLANDRLNGAVATLAKVTLSPVSSTHPGVTLDPTDGSVDVAPQTANGSHSVAYRICERAMPANCDVATVVVAVGAQTIVVSAASLTAKEGASAIFTVRLSQRPTSPVVVTATFYAGTATVTPSPASRTFTPANWNVPQPFSATASKDSDKIDNAGTIHLSATGVATTPVVVRVLDTNRSANNPTATITAPLNGQTVSGIVDFTGTGTDVNGTVVEGRFSVDGVRIYTDTNSSGTYRVPARWNTRTVPNGWHILELRVTDNAGDDGRMTIKVFVSN